MPRPTSARWLLAIAAATDLLSSTLASAQQPHYPAPRPGAAPPAARQAQAPANVAGPQRPVAPAQPAAPQQPQAAAGQAAAPAAAAQAPFPALTPAQQQELDAILQKWQASTGQITSMVCDFTRWEEDLVFNKAKKVTGEIKFRAPDKGLYKVGDEVETWPLNNPQLVTKVQEPGEHWICDGMSVFEFDARQRQVIERKLPPELQGQAIVDGPLPFLFSADAAKLKQRYFLRLITPEAQIKAGFIWIQAFPRFQRDAANFCEATLVLRASDMQATHLQIVAPGKKSKTVHAFTGTKLNKWALPEIFGRDFSKPVIPDGWKLVEAQNAPPQPPNQPPLPAAPPQAQRVPINPPQLPPR